MDWSDYEARFASMVAAYPGGDPMLVLIDGDGALRWATKALVDHLGYDPEEWVGESMFALIHPDDLERAARNFTSARAYGGPRGPGLYRIIGADGPELMEAAAVSVDDHEVLFEVRHLDDHTRIQALTWEMSDYLERASDEASPEELATMLVRLGERHSDGTTVAVSFVRQGRLDCISRASLPDALSGLFHDRDLRRWNGTAGEAIFRRASVISEDVDVDPRWAEVASTLRAEGVRAVWTFPVPGLGAEAPAVGVIDVIRREPGGPLPADWPLFYTLASLATVSAVYPRGRYDDEIGVAMASDGLEHFEATSVANAVLEPALNDDGQLESLRFVAVNPAWTEVTGWSADEVVGVNVDHFVHPDDLRRVAEQVLEAGISSSPIIDLACRWRRPDGDYRWIRGVGVPDALTGRLYGSLFAFTADGPRPEASEVGLAHAFEMAPVAQAVLDQRGTVGPTNAAWRALLGHVPDGGRGASLTELIKDHQVDRVRTLLRSSPGPTVVSVLVELDRPTGSGWLRLQLRKDPITGSWFASFDDVAEERRRLDDLAEAKAEADRALAGKDAFLAAVTHELRTPLNSVISFADLLLTDLGREEDRSTYLERISRNGRHLLQLIDEILELARASSAGPGQLEPVEIRSLIRQAVSRCDVGSAVAEITEDGDVPLMVSLDRAAVELILRNLVENAAKYGADRVEIRLGTDDAGVRLDVIDDGIGIPADDLPYVLDAFRRGANAAAAATGTGLGLSLSQTFAERMGAQLHVASVEGEGTTVTLSGLQAIVA